MSLSEYFFFFLIPTLFVFRVCLFAVDAWKKYWQNPSLSSQGWSHNSVDSLIAKPVFDVDISSSDNTVKLQGWLSWKFLSLSFDLTLVTIWFADECDLSQNLDLSIFKNTTPI